MGCVHEKVCKETAARFDSGSVGYFEPLFSYAFDSSSSEGELSGQERSTGSTTGDGTCKRPRVSYLELTTINEGQIKIERETHYGDDYYADEDNWCTTDAGYDATVGKPSSEREVLTGHRVSDL